MESAADATGEESGATPGERRGLDQLYDLTYGELRRLAARIRGVDASATVDPTALVNEAWIKLAGSPDVGALPAAHFKRVAARAMRQVLVEAARRRHAEKRGGGASPITFDEERHLGVQRAGELLALDAALAELARVDARQASVIECRFFGGLEVAETAASLGVSEATVVRDWRVAKAWLAHKLGGA